ncbi:hypothetical protein BDV59DRAFT_197029 [Aspergillus ambiguus]|uniref:hydrophobin family protein n=1 Tax=Aspergillus ambiguus TaxID=176160 RepID=UPI003CCD020F
MKFFAVAALFTATAIAFPQDGSGVEENAGSCGSHAMCCKSQTAKGSDHLTEHEKGGLVDLLGDLNLPLLGDQDKAGRYSDCESLASLGGKCDSNTVCCPTGSQQGLVNIGCVGIPIKLL